MLSRKPAPSAPGQPFYHFVACDGDDYADALAAIEGAERDGHRFWIEHRFPRSAQEIAEAIDRCGAMVAFCSRNSATSLSLYRQVSRAAHVGKRIVAVSLDGAGLPEALAHCVPVHDIIDATEADWPIQFAYALDRVDPARRQARLPAPPVSAPAFAPQTVVVTPRPVVRVARRRRVSLPQSFINAFAAGVLALFAFAFLEITGGPPTERELHNVAAEVGQVARENLPSVDVPPI